MKCNFWLFDEDKTSLTEFLFESNSDDLVLAKREIKERLCAIDEFRQT